MNDVTTVVVLEMESDDREFPFGYESKLKDVISILEDALEEIPEEYRDDARFEIDSHSGYERCPSSSVKIYYGRPMTDEEVANREAEVKRRAAEHLEWTRKNLEGAVKMARALGLLPDEKKE